MLTQPWPRLVCLLTSIWSLVPKCCQLFEQDTNLKDTIRFAGIKAYSQQSTGVCKTCYSVLKIINNV